jgi:hypothetical protein
MSFNKPKCLIYIYRSHGGNATLLWNVIYGFITSIRTGVFAAEVSTAGGTLIVSGPARWRSVNVQSIFAAIFEKCNTARDN